MAECDYPPCSEPAIGARYLVVQPEPIGVNLCAEHAAVLERNRPSDDPDFWRWADAMLSGTGSG